MFLMLALCKNDFHHYITYLYICVCVSTWLYLCGTCVFVSICVYLRSCTNVRQSSVITTLFFVYVKFSTIIFIVAVVLPEATSWLILFWWCIGYEATDITDTMRVEWQNKRFVFHDLHRKRNQSPSIHFFITSGMLEMRLQICVSKKNFIMTQTV